MSPQSSKRKARVNHSSVYGPHPKRIVLAGPGGGRGVPGLVRLYRGILSSFTDGVASLKSNFVRAMLTVFIIAMGILALVGVYTAIEGLDKNLTENLSALGVNSFDVQRRNIEGGQKGGRKSKVFPRITYQQAMDFKEGFDFPGSKVSVFTTVSGTAKVRYASETTNPNVRIVGGDDNYLSLQAVNIDKGRNFSPTELQYGTSVALLGYGVAGDLMKNRNEVGEFISFFGRRYKVVGVLEEQGEISSNGLDDAVLIPTEAARQLFTNRTPYYVIRGSVQQPEEMDYAISQAEGLMRKIRQDRVGEEPSFEVEKRDGLQETLDELKTNLAVGGAVITFLILLGAIIGLMNIMLVSVTQRTREIGLRKALGATPQRIRLQFLIESVVICLVGGFIGIVLGVIAGNVVANLLGAPFVFPISVIIMGITVCVATGVVAGLIPAVKASRLDPIDSLRHE